MSRKRSLLPDIYYKRKRLCLAAGLGQSKYKNNGDLQEESNETKATLLFLRDLFPVAKFEHRLPPVILKHQLYSILTNRVSADKQLDDLQESGEVKVFTVGAETDCSLIVFTDDYRCHVQRVMTELDIPKDITEKFLKTVVRHCTSMYVDADLLIKEYSFTQSEISQLVKATLLVVRDPTSWWLSVPNAGIFVKSFTRGRKTVITMLKKCKYREILRSDLEQRKWPRLAKLGLLYHIHDIIGADLVECIKTTSGQLLRLKDVPK